MTGFTMSLRLCDDTGMVNEELIPEHPQGYTYLNLHNHLAAMRGYPGTDKPFGCTGSAHLAGEHIRCTSIVHIRQDAKQHPDAAAAAFIGVRNHFSSTPAEGDQQ